MPTVYYFCNIEQYKSVIAQIFQDSSQPMFTVWASAEITTFSESCVGGSPSESIEWYIKGQVSSWSYDFAPPPPTLDQRHTGRLRKRDNWRTFGGVWEEPNHTTVRKPNPLYLYFIIQSSLVPQPLSHLLFISFVSILLSDSYPAFFLLIATTSNKNFLKVQKL